MTIHYDLVQYPTSDTIKIVTHLLERITKTNDRLQQKTSRHTSRYACFYARAIPSIDIQSYLGRILKYCPCSNECFLSLLVYFDRMSRNSSGLRIDSYNIHRLVITGIMVASKFFSDIFYTNARYAKVGGLPVSELNALELQFLKLNNFKLNVQVEELQQYGDQLLWHWIRENQKSAMYRPVVEYKNEDYKPAISYKSDNGNNTLNSKIRSCSSHLLLATEKPVSEKYDSITRC
ncbi:cyclin-domain-containing protein [Gilbertella persicaria]|uniref:cyclin-domain-containing protein n=1 Tax=Gilbertella persicaria TaxID=101096 RepID=UPI00222128AE|nr:cyclin-domain-containing protein [Gilbertella persicaria]KAI8080227.1 cyclin-domain-containing protein [Gilbertella persicaria]